MANKIYGWNVYLNFTLIFLLFLFFCCLQTACLTQFLEAPKTPNLWICFTVYMALFRKLPENLVWIYLSSFVGLMFSPNGYMSFFLIGQMAILFYVRSTSIFWKGSQYFLMFYGSSILLFHASNYFLSLLLNFQTLSYSSYFMPYVIFVLFQVFWAILLGYPIYGLLKLIDQITQRSSALVVDTLLKEEKIV